MACRLIGRQPTRLLEHVSGNAPAAVLMRIREIYRDLLSKRYRDVQNGQSCPTQTFVLTMLSLGVPMIVMGDEVRRTQLGNNNAYCLDNDITWFDWTLTSRHADVRRFLKTSDRTAAAAGLVSRTPA